MRKKHVLLALGIWMVLLPFLGFPYSWKDVLTILSGLVLAYMSYTFFKEDQKNEAGAKKVFENFSENHDFEYNQEENKVKIQ